MTDDAPYRSVLDVQHGLVTSTVLQPPSLALELWQLAGFQEVGGSKAVAGGTGFSRGQAIARGVGEIVERYAYMAAAGRRYSSLPAGRDPKLEYWKAGGLCPNDHAVSELHWARATDLDSRSSMFAPVACVCPAGSSCFDKHPSGWASGLSLAAAVERAWSETLERDAFMAAWLGLVDVHRLPRDTLTKWWQQAGGSPTSLVDAAGRVTLEVGIIATSEHRWTAVAVEPDLAVPRTSAGLGCSKGLVDAVVDAVRELVQVRAFLASTRVLTARDRPRDDLALEEMKALELLSDRSARSAHIFSQRWKELAPESVTEPALWKQLYEHEMTLTRRGVAVIDASPLLPPAIRHLGWRVVHLLAPHAFQFRGDESLGGTWSLHRAAAWGYHSAEFFDNRPPHILP